MNLKNKGNPYQKEFPNYDKTPKAVIAALSMSLALRICGDNVEAARKLISEEWEVLHANKIVPQKPA